MALTRVRLTAVIIVLASLSGVVFITWSFNLRIRPSLRKCSVAPLSTSIVSSLLLTREACPLGKLVNLGSCVGGGECFSSPMLLVFSRSLRSLTTVLTTTMLASPVAVLGIPRITERESSAVQASTRAAIHDRWIQICVQYLYSPTASLRRRCCRSSAPITYHPLTGEGGCVASDKLCRYCPARPRLGTRRSRIVSSCCGVSTTSARRRFLVQASPCSVPWSSPTYELLMVWAMYLPMLLEFSMVRFGHRAGCSVCCAMLVCLLLPSGLDLYPKAYSRRLLSRLGSCFLVVGRAMH